MEDIRLKHLAEQLINHSVSMKSGENLLISCSPMDTPLVKELVRATYDAGAYPHVSMVDKSVQRCMLERLQQKQANVMASYRKAQMDLMDAHIVIATASNPMENAAVEQSRLDIFSKSNRLSSQKQSDGKVKWCVCIYPTDLYANAAGMSLENFEKYYFDVCCMDYAVFGKAMGKLQTLMERTDRVRICAPGTELTFSIKGVAKCVSAGERNIPDGEVYTAPVQDSVNGSIMFNVPSIYEGTRFEQICLTFKDGKVTQATANHTDKLNRILEIDSGARYVGEFAFGLNPKLTIPLGNTLFDEKIRGSIHLALGNALDLTDNGNRSAIHWDMVSLHTPDMGGGAIYFDDVLIRKDGFFVHSELVDLNRESFT